MQFGLSAEDGCMVMNVALETSVKGFLKTGASSEGLDWTGLDLTGLDRTRLDLTGLDWMLAGGFQWAVSVTNPAAARIGRIVPHWRSCQRRLCFRRKFSELILIRKWSL